MFEKKDKNCIFCKIAKGDLKADIKYEDDKILAFSDINPQAPVHILVIPRKHIATLNEADGEILGHLVSAARDIAGREGVSEKGYRLLVNCGDMGGQEVSHLHVHILGGRKMKWPPG